MVYCDDTEGGLVDMPRILDARQDEKATNLPS